MQVGYAGYTAPQFGKTRFAGSKEARLTMTSGGRHVISDEVRQANLKFIELYEYVDGYYRYQNSSQRGHSISTLMPLTSDQVNTLKEALSALRLEAPKHHGIDKKANFDDPISDLDHIIKVRLRASSKDPSKSLLEYGWVSRTLYGLRAYLRTKNITPTEIYR